MAIGSCIMREQDKTGRGRRRAVLRGASKGVAAAFLALALLMPAQAQFWSPFGGPARRPPASVPQQQQQQQYYNPFGGGFFGQPAERKEAPPPDYSHAPSAQRKTDQAPPTTPIVVMGDAMADWLAYGLEEAYSEQPEIGILRKHRTTSGLIRYDPRRDVDWAQTAREIIAAEKPKLIVMMIGSNDHQAIRERAPPPRGTNPATGKPGAAPGPTGELAAAPTEDPANSELPDNPEQPAIIAPEPGRNSSASGPFEFHTDQWEAAYIKRIDATIAALKSAGVPVLWVGLPAQRGPRATADASYLNELYRGRAEKAGIVYVDVWDGFVDEQGRYSQQGPDFEGQIRRLRSGDGVYFTKAGARKLAHYVEREIGRVMANRSIPVALPSAIEPNQPGARPSGPAARPLAGPVVPLTASASTGSSPEELLGGARPPARAPAAADPLATRVLIKGETIGAPSGRADDFSWPRGAAVNAEPDTQPAATSARPGSQPPAAKTAPPPAAAAKPAAAASAQRLELDGQPDDTKPKPPKKPAVARPPAPVGPLSIVPNVMFR
jgi:hypothetical protein